MCLFFKDTLSFDRFISEEAVEAQKKGFSFSLLQQNNYDLPPVKSVAFWFVALYV